MKGTKRRLAARAVAALAVAGALAVVAPQSASASDFLNPCDLRSKIDELQGWGSDTSNNIVVFKATAQRSSHFDGVVAEGSTKKIPCGVAFGAKEYRWVVFKGDGEFVHQGDGGFRNWAYYGITDRFGEKVVFHRR
ncbi:hypothetical protein ABT263_35560 [Kitasatospora sp. NPDC001603]|uniref:hypothetical protein n=1 Tax=Kitasatospora sp. NPDC001603 TaxID=3154388 RepID=UPI0033232EE4